MQENYFQTADWFLTIWLIANQFEVKSIDKRNHKKCQFAFERSPELEHAVRAFWSNQSIKVQDFILAIKKAKTFLYADSF